MKDKTLGEVAEGEVRSTISVVLWAVLSLTSFFYGGEVSEGQRGLAKFHWNPSHQWRAPFGKTGFVLSYSRVFDV